MKLFFDDLMGLAVMEKALQSMHDVIKGFWGEVGTIATNSVV